MEMACRKMDTVIIVTPQNNRIDVSVASDFKQEILKLFDANLSRIIINFENVQFMDSSGLTAIVSLLKHLGESGAELVLCHINSSISNLLKITKLDRVFTIHPTEQSALLD